MCKKCYGWKSELYTCLPDYREEKLFILLKSFVVHRRTDSDVCGKNLMDYIKDFIQGNRFQHRLDAPGVQEMSKRNNGIELNEFLSAAFMIFSHRSKADCLWCVIPVSAPASFICPTVCSSLRILGRQMFRLTTERWCHCWGRLHFLCFVPNRTKQLRLHFLLGLALIIYFFQWKKNNRWKSRLQIF